MNPIHKLNSLGQSLWYDNIQRHLLESGELAAMISRGDIRGITSNPSIFQNAIEQSCDYDSSLVPMAWSGWGADTIFWQLAIEDIRSACDLFLPLYRKTKAADGYVSLEVSPTMAYDTDATVSEAGRLWEWVNRPNLMIKIPATSEGLPAIHRSIADGINVNVTLIFSVERYKEVIEAYLAGLTDRLESGLPIDHIASVASFFVSRVDTKVDRLLEDVGTQLALEMRGQAAIANAKLAYRYFQDIFGGERFNHFKTAGCRVQRPLWASTSTKNPAYPDTLYVDELIGPDTVNTVPPQTLEAYREHGQAELTLQHGLEDARRIIDSLESLGISMAQVTQELESEGVQAFANAFTGLLGAIEARRAAAALQLGHLLDPVSRRMAHLIADSVPDRMRSGDPSIWTTDPKGQTEIRSRLGWITSPQDGTRHIAEINTFVAQVRSAGFTHALLLGMGGSSLAPEVISRVFPRQAGYLDIAVLDSTDPAQVLAVSRALPEKECLYIVSSKSGCTAEVNALFNYFWERAGRDGSSFIAITDPGTPLELLGLARDFRRVFLSEPTVGGRFSALTPFGLVPAALLGVDLEVLLERSIWMASQCSAGIANIEASVQRNPGFVLGTVMGQAALDGRDKLTLISDDELSPVEAWLEQLVAESTGKQGKGIIVVTGETVSDPEEYADDRMFVYLRRTGQHDLALKNLQQVGHPVLVVDIVDDYDLGAEFYRWSMAVSVACAVMGVNPFDQPDVQDNKDRTQEMIEAYKKVRTINQGTPAWEQSGVKIFAPTTISGGDLQSVVIKFIKSARRDDYIAINAFLPRNEELIALLQRFRLVVREYTHCATTLGFGPRFLHSTGQVHKGGPNNGLFLQMTADPVEDISIPSQDLSFGVLQQAQALGDYQALVARKRRILRIHFPSPAAANLLIKGLD